MTQSSAITIPDASTLAVDTSCIDCSEVELQEDKDFLMEKGENILRIVARAALEVGQEIVEVQERFQERDGTLTKFFESLEISKARAHTWANKYRAYVSYIQLFGDNNAEESFKALPDVAASLIWNLSEEYREALLADIAIGNPPTRKDVEELVKQPEVKLSKAEELLAKARVRKLEAEGIKETATGAEKAEAVANFHNAKASIANFEQQVADLKAQIEEEKLRTAEEAEAKANAEAATALAEKELQKLKFDDAKVRSERVKKLSTTLTVSLPQALADVSKFFAEIDSYDEGTSQHIYNSAKSLANEIADKL